MPRRAALAGVALHTPLVTSPVLDALTGGARVPQGRDPAAHRLVQVPRRLQQAVLDPAERARRRRGGVLLRQSCAGGGGGGEALGMPAVIVMPSDAPRPKRERTAALGAEVVLYDRAREDREAIARDIARAPRRHAGSALRRSAGDRRPGHDRPRDRRGPGGARARARHRRGHRVRRRADRRHRACRQGARAAGAASTPPSPRASTTMRARSAAAGAKRTRRSPARSAMR